MRAAIIFFILTTSLSAEIVSNVIVDNLGFLTADGYIKMNMKTGRIHWPKGKPQQGDNVLFWDAVVWYRTQPIQIDPSYTKMDALRDFSAIRKELRTVGRMQGNPNENAIRWWKCVRTIYPHIIK